MTALDQYVDEIHAAMNARLYTPAIALTLALPDICGKIAHPGTPGNGQRYRDWYRRWCANVSPVIGPDEAWALRNAVLHAGSDEPERAALARFIFTEPANTSARVQRHRAPTSKSGGELQIEITDFCDGVSQGVRAWQMAMVSDARITAEIASLLRVHPATTTV